MVSGDALAALDEEHPSFDAQQGLAMCPRCGRAFSGNGLYTGPVYDKTGTHYDSYYDTDPMEGPFFHPDCHKKRVREIQSTENESLEDF